jgi:hypothetical protein
VHYEITVEGILGSRLVGLVRGPAADQGRCRPDHHRRPVADQAALHGLLARIGDLGLPLLAVRHADPP